MKRTSLKAFTLIELSISIVVIGLVVGAVLGGSSLIRAAQLNAVLTEANNYILSTNNFRQQYRYLPGDFATASTYWSTTNGDGNGQILNTERFLVWQHLNLAGFVEKKLTGAQGASPTDFVIGSNTPDSKLKGAGWAIEYVGTALDPVVTASTSTYAVNLGNALSLGASAGTSAGAPRRAVLTAAEAANLDIKADDGIPGTGKWVANLTGPGGAASPYNFGDTNACATGTNAGPGTYKTTGTATSCSFFIATGQ